MLPLLAVTRLYSTTHEHLQQQLKIWNSSHSFQ